MTAEELFHSETCVGVTSGTPVCPVMLREGYTEPRNGCDCPRTRAMLGYAECQALETLECPVRKVLFGQS